MQDFKKLDVWQKSHRLALAVYRATADFPSNERYGLTSQAQRAAVSIPAKIAEGCGREGKAEFTRFLQIAIGSATELEYLLLLARDLNFLNDSDHTRLNDQVSAVRKMLVSLIKKLRNW